MAGFFKKIREASIQKKRRFSMIVSAALTGVIFLVWISVSVSNTDGGKALAESITPIRSLGAAVAGGFSGIKSQFSGIKESFSNFVPEPPATTTLPSDELLE